VSKDLGTYYVRVELADGRGWLQRWDTGQRFTDGDVSYKPLSASRIPPTWGSEQELFETIDYMFLEGNYSCDCNKRLFLARASHEEEPEESHCGDTLKIKRLTVIRPDATEHVLYELEERKHPVDALKDWAASAGVEMAPEREAELRAICDEPVPLWPAGVMVDGVPMHAYPPPKVGGTLQ
jgi:hypothetical protein